MSIHVRLIKRLVHGFGGLLMKAYEVRGVSGSSMDVSWPFAYFSYTIPYTLYRIPSEGSLRQPPKTSFL